MIFFSRISPEEGAYLTEYLVETLYTADEKEKCKLYGFIFRELVLNNISKKEAKRLFYAIQNSFIEDIEKLDFYVSTRIGDDEISASLLNVGLLQSSGSFGGAIFQDSPSGTAYTLSSRGRLLSKILRRNNWLDVLCNK